MKRFLLALVCTLALSGCFASKAALVTPAQAVAPFANGQTFYWRDSQGSRTSQYLVLQRLSQSQDYRIGGDNTWAGSTLRLWMLQPGAYVGQIQSRSEYYFALFVEEPQRFRVYELDCKWLTQSDRNQMQIETVGTTCYFASKDQLINAIRTVSNYEPAASGYYARQP